jgi:hypothetical protein
MEQIELFGEGTSTPRNTAVCHAEIDICMAGNLYQCSDDPCIIPQRTLPKRERFIDQGMAIAEACSECCMPISLCCHR